MIYCACCDGEVKHPVYVYGLKFCSYACVERYTQIYLKKTKNVVNTNTPHVNVPTHCAANWLASP